MVTRRQFLVGSALGAASLVLWPQVTFAATGARTRFVFVLLRGGLDGLEAVPPYGDPGYAAIRGPLALSPGAATAAHRLDGVFALHPAFNYAAELYARGEFMPVVAAAPPYWGRSHFQAQDCVENGTGKPNGANTGWLNRCVAAMPGVKGLSCSVVMPLTMRGPASVETWSPPLRMDVNPILLQRLQPLYAADPRLAAPFARAIEQQRELPKSITLAGPAKPGAPAAAAPEAMLPSMLRAAGGFMGKAQGPRVAFVEDDGWDTHAREAAVVTQKIGELDAGIKSFHDAIGPMWSETVIVVVTEFGRTARVNGDGGTDHGTGGAMFLTGGAIRGGRIFGQWPGAAAHDLFENRDIHATTDFRSVFKGLLTAHLDVPLATLETKVFPNSAQARPTEGLLVTNNAVGRA